MKKIVNPGLYAVSGFRRSGKTSVFLEVERLFREQYSDLPIVFLPHVLGERPHPLDWAPAEHKKHATTRLFDRWADLNEACFKVRAEFAKGNIVFVDEFGLDAYLDAIACKDCQSQKDEAFQLHHHHLVPARIVTQNIRPPIYFIPRAWVGAIHGLQEFHASIEYEIGRYFDNTGQNPPIFLEGNSIKERAKEIVAHVLSGVQHEVFV